MRERGERVTEERKERKSDRERGERGVDGGRKEIGRASCRERV